MNTLEIARALASQARLDILSWLKEPQVGFVSVREGDLDPSGVCVSLIAHRAGISQPTASRHLEILRRAGLIKTHRIAQWNYHSRDESGIARARELLGEI